MKEVYIVSAKRTPIGNFLGQFSGIPAHVLGAKVISATASCIDQEMISQVIMGQVLTAGNGQNTARQASMRAGLGVSVPAFTINQVCASGLKSIILGHLSIAANGSIAVIAGGQESMSSSHHSAYIRNSKKTGNYELLDTMIQDGLTDAFSQKHMGITAENIAKQFGITRLEQDQFAARSQTRAAQAIANNLFEQEIVPIEVINKNGSSIITQDEFVKPGTTIDILSKLKPSFDPNGTVTAGNSSGVNDGAAAVLLCSAEYLKKHKASPIARIVSFAECGVEPDIMGVGPIYAANNALSKAGWKVDDLDLVELNEAFAAQAVYNIRKIGLNDAIVNINGGAIALGHPIGASGARILVTLLHNMQRLNKKKGMCALCVGGGMGVAVCVEKL